MIIYYIIIMIDEYVLQYITDFLKLCKRCNKCLWFL